MPILTLLSTNNNSNNNCCCRNNNIVVRRRRNTTTVQNTRIAQFTTIGSILVDAGDIIPLFNTQFNNISTNVQPNSDGSIDILTQGVYKLEYVAVVQNTSGSTQNFTLQLQSNGTDIDLTASMVTLENNQFATVTNQLILPVFVGTTRNITLINNSAQALFIVNANLVVTKLT